MKRLLYVALTRARDMLFLTATSDTRAKYRDREISILKPGIEAAGIEIETIPFEQERALAPSPAEPPPFGPPGRVLIEGVPRVLSEIPVTALSVYAKCPKQFEYSYVLGHPGISEGSARARSVGSLTHKALELGINTLERLRPLAPEASDEMYRDALDLANRFRGDEAFSTVRNDSDLKEVRFAAEVGGLRFIGVADVVGNDFVLDFKTDASMEPNEHRFQVWAYQKALGKPRALIAYLRHSILHEWTADELTAVEEEGFKLIDRIKAGDYAATPSARECSRCAYSSICPFNAVDATEPEPTTDPIEPVQLGFAFS